MNSLEQIDRNNAAAIADSIPALRAAGKWVVSVYAGLHFFGCSAHDTEEEARARLSQHEAEGLPGNRHQLLEPTGTAEAEHLGEIQPVTTVVGAIGGGSGDVSGGTDSSQSAASGYLSQDNGGGAAAVEGDGLAVGTEGGVATTQETAAA